MATQLYQNLDVAVGMGHITSGDNDDTATGIIKWNGGGGLLDLSIHAPDGRYQACLKVAHDLKTEYPLTGLDPTQPAQWAELEKREAAIVTRLIGKIHEQYGEPNQAIANNETFLNATTNPTLHNDLNKARQAAQEAQDGKAPKDIPRLSEFNKGDLVCRHYAPLASALLTEAGLANFDVSGIRNDFAVSPGGEIISYPHNGGAGVAHDYLVSQLTGNPIEATTSNASRSYLRCVNGVTPSDLISGKTIIAITSDGRSFSSYGTGEGITDRMADIGVQAQQVAQHDLELAQKTYSAHTQAIHPVQQVTQQQVQRPYMPSAVPQPTGYPDPNPAVSGQYANPAIPSAVKAQTLHALIEARNFNAADALMRQGTPEDRRFLVAALAHEMTAAVYRQDLQAASFLIQHGALEGFSRPVQPIEVMSWPHDPHVPLNPGFQQGLAQTLGISAPPPVQPTIPAYGYPAQTYGVVIVEPVIVGGYRVEHVHGYEQPYHGTPGGHIPEGPRGPRH